VLVSALVVQHWVVPPLRVYFATKHRKRLQVALAVALRRGRTGRPEVGG
jgi:hypothetical protein